MTTIFHLSPGELNEGFLERLKALFQDRDLELIVRELDASDYPFDNPKQVEFLEEEIRHYEGGGEMVRVPLDELRLRGQ